MQRSRGGKVNSKSLRQQTVHSEQWGQESAVHSEQWGQESAVGEDAESRGWRGRQGPERTGLYVSLGEWVWT